MPVAAQAPLSPAALVDACGYRYDAEGRLTRRDSAQQTLLRFWRGDEVANELHTVSGTHTELTWLRALGQPVVEQRSGATTQVTLLAGAVSGSILLELSTGVRAVTYAPHGQRTDDGSTGTAAAAPAFNGEMLDAGSNGYLLGAGHHRPYSPTLGLFLAPDSASPFGAGGLNSLTYCAGDPINRADPTGHFWKWVVAAVGVAFAAVAIAGSFGAASLAVGTVMAGGMAALTKSGAAAVVGLTLGVAAMGTEVGTVAALAAGDTKAATILGWVGVGLAVAGAAPAIARAATKGAAKMSRLGERLGRIRAQGLSGRGSLAAARKMAAESRIGESIPIGKSQLVADKYVHIFQGHGAPFATAGDGIVDGRTLGRQIRAAAGDGPPIQRVELQACYSATGGKYASQAQRVANELEVPTSGFNGVVHAGDPLQRTRLVGDRVLFTPQKGVARMRTALLNSSLHYVSYAGVHIRRFARHATGAP